MATHITARQIFETPVEQIWNIPEGDYLVTYDDGHQLLNHRNAIIFDRFCWDLFTLAVDVPITKECSSISVIGDGYFNSNTHLKMLETIFRHICDTKDIRRYRDKEALLSKSYDIVNRVFNEIVHRVSDYVTTIDAMDFVRVIKDPDIERLHDKLTPTPESVEITYKGIRSYMNDPRKSNGFIRDYRSKAVNENQANQCVGPRGFVTALDRTVYRRPVVNGFIRGMQTLYEIMVESLTAAKSLNANDTHIRVSEYASRRIQLVTMVISTIDPQDCGSTNYMDMLVTARYLPNLKGKYYVHPDTGKLECISGKETELIDRVIKLRTAFGCNSPDPHRICTTCLGRLSENFKENSNLGYVMTAFLMEKLTQSILSTKHLTHSVKKSAIKLEGEARRFFSADDNNDIYFNKDLNLNEISLVLPSGKLNKLIDVLSLEHTNVALSKVGELEVVGVRVTRNGQSTQETVNISYRDRLSNITRALLNHIKFSDTEVDSKGNFIVPMVGFDPTKPVFNNQLKETNIVSFVNRIASMIEATKKSKLDLTEHFFALVDTILDQFPCNISVLETIVYATTTFNAGVGNYRLARNSPHPEYKNRTLLFRHRSISQLLVFEGGYSEMIKNAPVIFSNKYRSNHPLDALFTPQHIVKK